MKDMEGVGHVFGTEKRQRYLSIVAKGSTAQDEMAMKAQIMLGLNK